MLLTHLRIHTILALFFLPVLLLAQNKKLRNQPTYDAKPIHFGFCLGINTYDFRINPKVNLPSIPGFYDVVSETSPGYSIGIISNLRLNNYMDLRFVPTFAATVRYLTFDIEDPYTQERSIEKRELESSFILLPIELKFKTERMNNHRWYVLGGFTYGNDLASKEKVEDDRLFKLKRQNMYWDAGVGIDIYLEYFKFSPQIKASFGINNMLVQDGTIPVSGIDKLLSRCILINFTFE